MVAKPSNVIEKGMRWFRWRILIVAAIICMGVALSLWVFLTNSHWDYQRMASGFRQGAQSRITIIEHKIEKHFQLVDSLGGLLVNTPTVTRRKFQDLARPFMKHRPSIQTLAWTPKIANSQRAAMVAMARSQGLEAFYIKALDSKGSTVKAPDAPAYFPFYFMEPLDGNRKLLGLDLSSCPRCLEVLLRAMDSGEIGTITHPGLMPPSDWKYDFLVLKPVYRAGEELDSPAERRQNLRGFVTGFFSVATMLEGGLNVLGRNGMGIDTYVYDVSSPSKRHLLYFHSSPLNSNPSQPITPKELEARQNLKYQMSFDVAGRKWQVVCLAAPEFFSSYHTVHTWLFFIMGLLLTVLAALFINRVLCQINQQAQANLQLNDEIAKRENAEAGIAESEKRLRVLINASPDFICFKDGQGRWQEANRAGLDIFQLKRDQYQGKTDLELAEESPFLRQALQVCENSDEVAWEQRGPYRTEEVVPNADGEDRIFDVIKVPIFHQDGGRSALVVWGRDITARVRIETALRNEKELFRALADGAPMGIVLINSEDRHEYLNPKIQEMFGYTLQDIPTGEEWFEKAYPDDEYRRSVTQVWFGDIKNMRPGEVGARSFTVRCKDGSDKIVEFQVVALKNGGRCIICEDVTARRQADEALQQQARELSALNKLGHGVNASLSPDMVVKAALEQIGAALDPSVAMVFLRDRENGRLVLKGISPEGPDSPHLDNPFLCLGECLCGLAAKSKQSVYSFDLDSDNRCTNSNCKDAGLRSFASLPLKSGEETIGILGLGSVYQRDFSEQASLLETLSHAISVGLSNALLFAELQEKSALLEDRVLELKKAQAEIAIHRDHLEALVEERSEELIKLSLAVEQSNSSVVITDTQGNIEYVNKRFTEVTGYSQEEALGQNPRILKSGETPPEVYEKMWQSLISGGIWRGEIINRKKNGEKYWEYAVISAVKNPQGEVINYLALKEDITARKRAEQAIKESENKYRSIFEDSPVALWLEDFSRVKTHLTGLAKAGVKDFRSHLTQNSEELMQLAGMIKVLDVNQASLGLFEAKSKKDLLTSLDRILPQESLPELIDEIATLAEGGSRFGTEIINQTLSGKKKHLVLQLTVVPGYEEDWKRVLVSLMDITERVKAEEALTRQSKLDSALAALYKPIISPQASIGGIANLFLKQALSITGSAHGYVGSIDPATGNLIVSHNSTEMMKGQCKVSREDDILLFPCGSDGSYPKLWGHSLNTGQAFFTNNPQLHHTSGGVPGGHIPLQRFLSVPIFMKDQLVGQISLANSPSDYTDQDLAAINRLGEYYSLALLRKQVEQELADSEARYRTFIEHSNLGVQIVTGTEITFSNQKYAEIFGYESPEEVVGKDLADVVHPDDLPMVSEYSLRRQRGEKVPTEYDYRGIRKDGEMVNIHVSVTRVNIDGTPVSLVFSSDITERIKAEKALAESQEKLSELGLIVNSSPSIAFLWRAEKGWPVEYVSENVRQFGYTPQDFYSGDLPYADIIHPGDLERIGKEVEEFSEENRESFIHEYRIITKDGDVRWVNDPTWVRRDEQNKITHYQGILSDITELKMAEERLREAKEAAEAANKAKSEFLANMSHEIRTPMNAIIGMTDLALMSDPTPVQRSYLDSVKVAADSLLNLLNDILDFSKIEAGRLSLEDVEFDLEDLLDSTLTIMEIKAREKGLKLDSFLDPSIPRVLRGDPHRLRQILVNLVGNSLKFTEKGKVSIEVKKEPAKQNGIMLHFSVADTGIGIPSEKLDQIFARFSQADGSTTRRFGGTGLGTSISKQLAEMMGGSIWAESVQGQGSTFHFTVKLKQGIGKAKRWSPASGKKPAKPAPAAKPATVGLKLLLVEDNEINQKLAVALLGKKGHEVTVAENGEVALEIFEKGGFDLVLMDVQMPRMDGMEATRRIREMENAAGEGRIPIVAMTAHAMKEERRRCLDAGMDEVITKPINKQVLFGTVERLGGASRKREANKPEQAATVRPVEETVPSKLADVSKLPGLEVSFGVNNLGGDLQLYRKLTGVFLEDHADSIRQIQAYFKGGDVKSALRVLHTLKGVCGNLGANELFRACRALERAIKSGEPGEIGSAMDGFTAKFAEAVSSMKALHALQDEANGDGRITDAGPDSIDPESVAPLLSDIAAALESDFPLALDLLEELRGHLSGSRLAPQLEELEIRLNRFDTEAAYGRLGAIAAELDIDWKEKP